MNPIRKSFMNKFKITHYFFHKYLRLRKFKFYFYLILFFFSIISTLDFIFKWLVKQRTIKCLVMCEKEID